ncbi:MAG: hypothetical protein O3B22_18085 [Proteobacteria bacterium]|nr:hypothetical protein [Pseudomonadota bacterium]
MAAETPNPVVPGRVLRLLIPWFVLPVLASPLAVLAIQQGAGAWVGLDRTAFRLVCQAMLAGAYGVWCAVTLAGAAAAGYVHWRARRTSAA